jgi:hypothetical protein
MDNLSVIMPPVSSQSVVVSSRKPSQQHLQQQQQQQQQQLVFCKLLESNVNCTTFWIFSRKPSFSKECAQ